MGESYDEIVNSIYQLQKFTGKITLDPITELMEQLDNPHTDFDSIHVAGTNGKGSTTLILAAILEEAGYTVGTYTSPHLTDFRERVQVNGENISKEEVAEYYTQIEEQDVDLSFFEFTTALAFMHFSEKDVDVAVVEAGLGGRLDATNILSPELSVITNVGQDHTAWLGETPEQIAYEKAGIIKKEVPVVTGAEGTPQQVINRIALKNDAPLITAETRVRALDTDDHELRVTLEDGMCKTNLIGDYQLENIELALTACDMLNESFDITDNAIQDALSDVVIPGRMECIAEYPFVLLDGAHNPEGMKWAADTIERVQRGKTISVVSIMGDKNYESMMKEIEAVSDLIIVSQADMDRAADPQALADCITETDYEIMPDIDTVLAKVLQLADDEDTIVFTGSMYFVGNVKQALADMRCTY